MIQKTRLLLVALTLFFLSGCSTPARDIPMGALRVRVVDAHSGAPIPHIPVLRIFSTEVYGNCFNLFPRIDPTGHHHRDISGTSDSEGLIVFPAAPLKLGCAEHLVGESVVVNLGLKSGVFEKERGEFMPTAVEVLMKKGIYYGGDDSVLSNPVSRYRGHVIQFRPDRFEEDRPHYRRIHVSESVRQSSEALIVELQRTETE